MSAIAGLYCLVGAVAVEWQCDLRLLLLASTVDCVSNKIHLSRATASKFFASESPTFLYDFS
jgi:hypothetical protein